MASFNISLKITAPDTYKARDLAATLQAVTKVVAYEDMMKLLTKVKTSPQIVKTALKFI